MEVPKSLATPSAVHPNFDLSGSLRAAHSRQKGTVSGGLRDLQCVTTSKSKEPARSSAIHVSTAFSVPVHACPVVVA